MKLRFVVDDQMSVQNGYAVRRENHTFIDALFIDESEAIQYSDYKNKMLNEYGHTDHNEYKQYSASEVEALMGEQVEACIYAFETTGSNQLKREAILNSRISITGDE